MTFPHNHKTVIVLDRSPLLLRSSGQNVEFDIFFKNRSQSFIPMSPVLKTLWTCSVEAAVEYARIVYDIHPANRLIRLITSDCDATVINAWGPHDQNTQQMMTGLATRGPPDGQESPDECSVMHGLTRAIELLCEPSPTQHEMRTSLDDDASDGLNRGRIICLTHIKSEKHGQMLEECVLDALSQHNKLAAGTDNLMPITQLDMALVHMVPIGTDSAIPHRARKELSPALSSEIHVSQSGSFVACKMVELAIQHFTLASTTVIGIPMKEEQNAASSANYDVELLHSSEAHMEILKSGNAEGLVMRSKQGLYTDTITLKWCTPKSTSAAEIQQCTGAFRISPVDVNSRPSSCLTNFLLGGRSVLLEQPRKTGTRVISHMLSSHGGEIYIHVLSTVRSSLEDPPSISEGSGGRVTDYRINDFGEMMKRARLAPVVDATNKEETPIERAKCKLERMTRHWPMVISDTIIFNMPSHFDPLLSLIIKEQLTEDEVLECKKAVYHVVGMESRNEPLPVPATGNRGKGPKREEQYRQMWSELEKYVRVHSDNSSRHLLVLDCVLDCKKPTVDSGKSPKKSTTTTTTTTGTTEAKEAKEKSPADSEMQQSLKELDKFQGMTEREKQDLNIKTEPSSPPATKRIKTEPLLCKPSSGQSLLAMWTTRIGTLHSQRHQEFAGRQESSGNKAELYIHMKDDKNNGNIMDTKPNGIKMERKS